MKKLLIGLIVVIVLALISFVSWKVFQVFIVKGIEYIFSQDYTCQVDFNENNTLSEEDKNILKEIYDLNIEITNFTVLYVNYDGLEYQGESSASILLEVDKNELINRKLFNSTQNYNTFNVEIIEENDNTIKIKIKLISMEVAVDTNYIKVKEIVNKYK